MAKAVQKVELRKALEKDNSAALLELDRLWEDKKESFGSPRYFFRVLTTTKRPVSLGKLSDKAAGISFDRINRDLRILIMAGLVQRIGKGFRISPWLLGSKARIAIAQAVLDEEFAEGKIERHTKDRGERNRIIRKLIKEVWGIDVDTDMLPYFYRIKEDVYNLSLLLSDVGFKKDRVYTIRYDRKRLQSYAEVIGAYARILKQNVSNPKDIKVIPSDGEDFLVKVTCSVDNGRRIGEGVVDVVVSGDIKDYRLQVIGMLNIAMASSNIPEGLNNTDEYKPLTRFIKSQCAAILGRELVISDIRRIVLDLPRSHRINPEELQRLNKLVREVLMSA